MSITLAPEKKNSFSHRVSSFHLNNTGISITEKIIIPSKLLLLRRSHKDY